MMPLSELQAELRERPAEWSPRSPLTPRQREVILAYSRGLRMREIASFLQISPQTVKSHRQTIFAKLHVHTMTAACSLALREGWVR